MYQHYVGVWRGAIAVFVIFQEEGEEMYCIIYDEMCRYDAGPEPEMSVCIVYLCTLTRVPPPPPLPRTLS
jgi:hypothetical protein